MPSELEFDYPSADFFERIAVLAKGLPIVSTKHAKRQIEVSGSQSIEQSISSLVVRLKIEVAADFEKHENEADSIPYFATYVLVVETSGHSQFLSVLTALKSKNGHKGRVLYGSQIFRTAEDSYVSENSYGD